MPGQFLVSVGKRGRPVRSQIDRLVLRIGQDLGEDAGDLQPGGVIDRSRYCGTRSLSVDAVEPANRERHLSRKLLEDVREMLEVAADEELRLLSS